MPHVAKVLILYNTIRKLATKIHNEKFHKETSENLLIYGIYRTFKEVHMNSGTIGNKNIINK